MGWSDKSGILWGDAPQDLVDEAVISALSERGYSASDVAITRIPKSVREGVMDELFHDIGLRDTVDREFREFRKYYGVTSREFLNLLRVSLFLGGRTI